MKTLVVAALVGLMPSLVWAQGKTKLALVSTAPGKTGDNLLDLVQAKLSGEANLDLLERGQIAKLLQEQKLSLAGLIDAQTAVSAGKVLGADLFALLETDPFGKEALGLVIYDAVTGLKLHDAALPAQLAEQIPEAVAGTRQALKKHAAGAQGLRMVCVINARNADLPRSQDQLADTVAFLLERGLLASPSLGLLERKRLDWVTKEKALAAAETKDLLASLLTIEVEIGRGPDGQGVRAAAYVTDHQGKALYKAEARAAEAQADRLAAGLQKSLWRVLEALPADKAPDPRRESQRFHQEGQRQFSHKEFHGATRSLEAAFALDASNPKLAANLAKFAGEQAIHVLNPSRVSTNKPAPVTQDQWRIGLDLAQRSLLLRERSVQQRRQEPTFRAAFDHVNLFRQVPDHGLGRFIRTARPKDETEEHRRQREDYFNLLINIVTQELEMWSAVPEGPVAPAFFYYTQAMERAFSELAHSGPLEADMDRAWPGLLHIWLKEARKPESVASPYMLHQFSNESMPERKMYLEFFQDMSKDRRPILGLHGRLHLLMTQRKEKLIEDGKAQLEYQNIRHDAFQVIKDHKPKEKTPPQDDLRTSMYLFLFEAINHWPYPDPRQKFLERFALCDFMLDRNELVDRILNPVVQHFSGPAVKDSFTSQRWAISERTLALADSKQRQLCDNPTFVINGMREFRTQVIKKHPELIAKVKAADPPWKEIQTLLDPATTKSKFAALPGIAVGRHLVDGQIAYVPILETDQGQVWLRLLVYSLGEGKDGRSERVLLRPAQKNNHAKGDEILSCCKAPNHILVASRAHGLFAFDLADLSGKHLTKDLDLPSPAITSLAYLDNKAYLALDGGYWIALDLSTSKFEVLASSRRRERLSPFDDADVFRIHYVMADPERGRLLFLLYQKPGRLIYYPSFLIPPEETTNGLWEYQVKNKTFKRHLELYFEAATWGTPTGDGRLQLTKPGHHQSGLIEFDLVQNKAKLLWALSPIGPNLVKETAPSQEDFFPLLFPQFERDNWLWCGKPLSRVNLSKKQREHFALENDGGEDFRGFYISQVGRDRLLMNNSYGVWLARLKD